MNRVGFWSGILILAALCVPAPAQDSDAAVPGSDALRAAARQAREAAEELPLTRLLATLSVTREQAVQLLPAVQNAQDEISRHETRAAAAVGRLAETAAAARQRAVHGERSVQAVERQYAATAQEYAAAGARVRAEQAALVLARLQRLLRAEQWQALRNAIQGVRRQQAFAEAQAELASGRRGGGPLAWSSRLLDRVRGASPEEWASMRERIAAAQMPGGLSPRGGPRPGRTDPARLLALAEQVRGMSPQAYAAARSRIAFELWHEGREARERARGGAEDPNAEVIAFVEEHLLHPAAVRVLRRWSGTSR